MSGYFNGKPPNAPFKAPSRKQTVEADQPAPRRTVEADQQWRCTNCRTQNDDSWLSCEVCDYDRSIVAEREGDNDNDDDIEDGGVSLYSSSTASTRQSSLARASPSTSLSALSARKPSGLSTLSSTPSLAYSASSKRRDSRQATHDGPSRRPSPDLDESFQVVDDRKRPFSSFAASATIPPRKAPKRSQPDSEALPSRPEAPVDHTDPGPLDNYEEQSVARILHEMEARSFSIKGLGRASEAQKEKCIKLLRDADQRSRDVKANPDLALDYSTMNNKPCESLLKERHLQYGDNVAHRREILRQYDEGFSTFLRPIECGRYSTLSRDELVAEIREEKLMGVKALKGASIEELKLCLVARDRTKQKRNNDESAELTPAELRAEMKRRNLGPATNTSKSRMLKLIATDDKRQTRFELLVQLQLFARVGGAVIPETRAAVPYEPEVEAAEEAQLVEKPFKYWLRWSFHISWDASTMPEIEFLANQIKPKPTRGFIRIVAYVTALWRRMAERKVLNALAKEFYSETDPRDIITLFSQMLVDPTKALLDQQSGSWNQVVAAGESATWQSDESQGLYVILVSQERRNKLYTGSTTALDGFFSRVGAQHLSEKYRLQHPRTRVYREMAMSRSYCVKVYARMPPRWAQAVSSGAYRMRVCESILAAFLGSYPADEFYRVANELQYGLGWPHSIPASEAEMLTLETYRGYEALNVSIPCLEFAALGALSSAPTSAPTSSTQAELSSIWPELLNGVQIAIRTWTDSHGPKAAIHLGHRSISFMLDDDQARIVAENQVNRAQVQVHIADSGSHPESYAGLPESSRPEYESASSLAISISFGRVGVDPPEAITLWLKWADRGGSFTVIRKSRLGLAKFCMSIIDRCNGESEIPAGPERFDVDGQRDTADPKVWERDPIDGRQLQSESFTHAMWDLAAKCCSETIFTCPFCQHSVSSNRTKSVRVVAMRHFRECVECRTLAMSQIGLTFEEQRSHLSPCPHCDRDFGCPEMLMEHFRSTLEECRDKQNDALALRGEPLISLKKVFCQWCKKEYSSAHSLLINHWESASGLQCREKEQEQREENGVELLPDAQWRCFNCGETFRSQAVLHRHWAFTAFEACLLAENRRRSEQGEKLFAPRVFFCPESECKEATSVPFVCVTTFEVKRHYKTHHKGVEVPSLAKLREIPSGYLERLNSITLPNGRNAMEVYLSTQPTGAELQDVEEELDDDQEAGAEAVDEEED